MRIPIDQQSSPIPLLSKERVYGMLFKTVYFVDVPISFIGQV